MATQLPDETKAIVITGEGKAEIKQVPLPVLPAGGEYVLVKVAAVGVNPTDWKGVDSAGPARLGARCGCDFSGVVVRGDGVGERVAGLCFGAISNNHDYGSFAEYILAKKHMQLRVPDNVTDEEAATLGVSVITVGQGLYKVLELPLPTKPANPSIPVLIYGGSTATGIYGIKYAKLSGLTVIATSSPHNFALLKSLGADHVFDYKSPTAGSEIRALTNNRLLHAWDCTGQGASLCAAALSDDQTGKRPRYACIMPADRAVFDEVNPLVEGPFFTLGYDAFGEAYDRFGTPFEPDLQEVEFAVMWFKLSQELLESGRLTPLKPEVNRTGGGLEGVLGGMDELRQHRVSGGKLVYTL